MGWRTGTSRINGLIRWIGFAFFVGAGVSFFALWADGQKLAAMLLMGGLFAGLGATCLIVAWVVNGFLEREAGIPTAPRPSPLKPPTADAPDGSPSEAVAHPQPTGEAAVSPDIAQRTESE